MDKTEPTHSRIKKIAGEIYTQLLMLLIAWPAGFVLAFFFLGIYGAISGESISVLNLFRPSSVLVSVLVGRVALAIFKARK